MAATTSAPAAAHPTPRRQGLAETLFRRIVSNPVSLIGLVGAIVLVLIATVGPFFAPYDPNALSPDRLMPPSAAHPFGTENFGRDVLSRFLHGSRVSMLVGTSAVVFAVIVGTLIGMVAGLLSGSLVDTLLMRGLDVLLAFPLLVLVTVMAGVLGSQDIVLGPITINAIALVAFALGIVFMPIFARVSRASVLSEAQEDYITAARSFGARNRDLLFRNLLPNIMAPLIVQGAFSLAVAIAAEAAVSFLGIGVRPPEASWGTMLNDARRFVILGSWWLVVFPAAAIALAVLSFNLLGDALRDALDPRLRTSGVLEDEPARVSEAA